MSLKTLSLFYRHIFLERNGMFLRYYKVEIGTYFGSFTENSTSLKC